MDNVAFHKTKLFKDMLSETNNTVLYVPPYSPQYNPIEIAFSKIKSSYRKLNFLDSNSLESNILKSVQTLTANDLCSFYRSVTSIVQKNLNALKSRPQADVLHSCQNNLE